MKKPFKHLTNLLRFNGGASIPITGPLKAEWEVINQCNAKCLTCQHWQGKPDATILSTEEAKILIRQLSESGLLHLCFTGGEPLMRKDLVELVAYAKGIGLSTSIITNGLLITERLARKLVDAHLDSISISIDAADPALNDQLRGLEGYFDLAMNGLDNLKAMRSNAWPEITIKSTVTTKNVNQLVALAELARVKGVEGFSFQLAQILNNAGFEFDKSLVLNQDHRTVLIEQLNTLTREYKSLLAGSLEYYQALCDFLKYPESLKKYRPVIGFSYALIDAWGRVFLSPAKINRLGSIRYLNFDEIWFGQKANEIRKGRQIRLENSYLFAGIGNIGVSVSNLNAKRALRLLRPIFDGGKSL